MRIIIQQNSSNSDLFSIEIHGKGYELRQNQYPHEVARQIQRIMDEETEKNGRKKLDGIKVSFDKS